MEWTVTFKVKFTSDMFPGFGNDPMDIVKAMKRDLEKTGSVPHYVKDVLIIGDIEGANEVTDEQPKVGIGRGFIVGV